MSFDVDINKLIVWAESKNYYIDFQKDGDDCICPITKVIEINCSNTEQTQLYSLLHECGHVLINKNSSYLEVDELRMNELKGFDSKEYRIKRVHEEMEAWLRAKKLAKRLSINIDEDSWEKQKNEALYKYIVWASKSK